MIPELPSAENVLVVGPVASGKTYLLNKWMEPLSRLVVFEGVGEVDRDDPRFTHVSSIGALRLALYSHSFGFSMPKELPHYRIVFHAENATKARNLFPEFLATIWKLDQPRHLFIDEVQQISDMEWTDTALRFARKRLLGIVGATQRLADVTTTYRSNSRTVVLFHTHEGRDLEAIRDSWGAEAEEKVTELRPLIYDDVKKKTVQTPQALYYRRGLPLEVIDL